MNRTQMKRIRQIFTAKKSAGIRIISVISVLLFLISCSEKKSKIIFSKESEITGLASPITLQQGETKIFLEDFFKDVSKIDSVSVKNISAKLSGDKKVLSLNDEGKEVPKVLELKFWVKNFSYSILLKKSRKINYTFTYDSRGESFKSILLSGEFNGWTPKNTELKKENGIWKTDLNLDAGKYQYQIVVDGKWMLDKNNPDSIDNGVGGFNSL